MKTLIEKPLMHHFAFGMVAMILLHIFCLNCCSYKVSNKYHIIDGHLLVPIKVQCEDMPILYFGGAFDEFTSYLEYYDSIELTNKALDSISSLLLADSVFHVCRQTYCQFLYYYIKYYLSVQLIEQEKVVTDTANWEFIKDFICDNHIILTDSILTYKLDNLGREIDFAYIYYNVIDTLRKYFLSPKDFPAIMFDNNCVDLSYNTYNFYRNHNTFQKQSEYADSLIENGIFYLDSLRSLQTDYESSTMYTNICVMYHVVKYFWEKEMYFYYYIDNYGGEHPRADHLYGDSTTHHSMIICYGA